eukprot:582_1
MAQDIEMQTTHPFLEEGWVRLVSKDNKIYYQNKITKHTQWEPPIEAAPKSPNIVCVNTVQTKNKDQTEWRAVQTDDGRVYWQNDTTKQSRWKPPQQTLKSPKNIISNEDQKEDIIPRKLWHKEHIIWILTFILTIYDFITDIQVAEAWFKLGSICPQFRCKVHNPEAVLWAVLLFIASGIGFIAALVLKYLDAKTLYVLYKFPMPAEDILNHELVYFKKFIFWGWVPLIVEDVASVWCIMLFWMNTDDNVAGLTQKYTISITLSILSVFVSIVLSCRKNKKLTENKAFLCERICNCFWSVCAFGCVSMAITMVVMKYLEMNEPVPFIGIFNDNTDYCKTWNEYNSYIINKYNYSASYTAKLTDAPNMIYNDSHSELFYYHSDQYGIGWYDNWTFICFEHGRDIILNCEIQWSYLGQIDLCQFDIESGFCGDLTIQCENNFTFYDGNPKMYACIDYCSL